jgi:hypothetical protein
VVSSRVEQQLVLLHKFHSHLHTTFIPLRLPNIMMIKHHASSYTRSSLRDPVCPRPVCTTSEVATNVGNSAAQCGAICSDLQQ